MDNPTTVAEVSPLFGNAHVREFFFQGMFGWMDKLGFCGMSLDNDGEISLYKDRGTYYEPFCIREFNPGTETEALFISIIAIFDGFEIDNPLYVGINGFSKEELERRAANA